MLRDQVSFDVLRGTIQPPTFDESVFDGVLDRPENCCLSDGTFGCIFHIFIPPVIMAALAAKHAGIVGHRSGEIDNSMALSTFEKRGR